MGFRPEVDNFQPYYAHSASRKRELRVGASILAEALEREELKIRKKQETKETKKQLAESISRQVKLNYEEDRREKQLRDQMEKQRRLAASSAIADDSPSPATPSPATATIPLKGGASSEIHDETVSSQSQESDLTTDS